MNGLLTKYEGLAGNLIFSYRGNPSAERIQLLVELVEKKLIYQETNRTILKRVLNILVEVLQNVFKHREDFVVVDYRSFNFYLLKYPDHYCIVSGNYIKKENVIALKEKLNKYISFSDVELDATYKNVLLSGNLNINGGAGLGLMDIMRKSARNISYEVVPVDKGISFFLIEVKLSTLT